MSLKLYFDISSPYAWIAFESLIQYEKHLGVPLKITPVAIGFIMHASGNHGPMAIPRKGSHMVNDLVILSRYWGFQIRAPSNFEATILKRGTLKAQRLLTAIEMNEPSALRRTARELWNRVWNRDQPVYEMDHLREVCQEVELPNYEKLLELSTSQPVKEKLKESTDEAIASGAFGLPWIILKRNGEQDVKIFGSDRLHIICNMLGKEFVGKIKTNPEDITSTAANSAATSKL